MKISCSDWKLREGRQLGRGEGIGGGGKVAYDKAQFDLKGADGL